MDTTEELYGYFYAGMPNLSAGELFFWITVDETMKQLGVDDVGAVIAIILGQPKLKTRQKFAGSIKGTSVASVMTRKAFPNAQFPFGIKLPTITAKNIRSLRLIFTRNLGTFVGRSIPVLGWFILANDVATISYYTLVHYNMIAREDDKFWN